MSTTAVIGIDGGPGGRDALALGHQLASRVVAVETGGDVGDGLRDLAEQHHADLVVVGSSRRRGLGRLVMGDDVRTTLHASQVPVAVALRAGPRPSVRWNAWASAGPMTRRLQRRWSWRGRSTTQEPCGSCTRCWSRREPT